MSAVLELLQPFLEDLWKRAAKFARFRVPRHEAEDVVQECFVNLLASKNPSFKFNPSTPLPDQFFRYFRKSIRNKCIDHGRKKNCSSLEHAPSSDRPSFEESVENDDFFKRTLVPALNMLPDEIRIKPRVARVGDAVRKKTESILGDGPDVSKEEQALIYELRGMVSSNPRRFRALWPVLEAHPHLVRRR